MEDPWPDEPPSARGLFTRELTDFLSRGIRCNILPDWEEDFCSSILDQIHRRGHRLSPKQIVVLDRIIANIWLNDPALWPVYDETIGVEPRVYRGENKPFLSPAEIRAGETTDEDEQVSQLRHTPAFDFEDDD